MSTLLVGYLLLCASLGIIVFAALSDKKMGERLGSAVGVSLFLASIGVMISALF